MKLLDVLLQSKQSQDKKKTRWLQPTASLSHHPPTQIRQQQRRHYNPNTISAEGSNHPALSTRPRPTGTNRSHIDRTPDPPTGHRSTAREQSTVGRQVGLRRPCVDSCRGRRLSMSARRTAVRQRTPSVDRRRTAGKQTPTELLMSSAEDTSRSRPQQPSRTTLRT